MELAANSINDMTIAKLRQKVARMEISLRDKDTLLTKMKLSCNFIQINELKTQSEVYFNEVIRLKKEVSDLNQKLSGAISSPMEYQKTEKFPPGIDLKIQKLIEKLHSENSNLKSRCTTLEKKNKLVQNKTSHTTHTNGEKVDNNLLPCGENNFLKEIESYKDEINELKQSKIKQNNEIEKLQTLIQEINKEKDSFRKEADEQRSEHEAMKNDLKVLKKACDVRIYSVCQNCKKLTENLRNGIVEKLNDQEIFSQNHLNASLNADNVTNVSQNADVINSSQNADVANDVINASQNADDVSNVSQNAGDVTNVIPNADAVTNASKKDIGRQFSSKSYSASSQNSQDSKNSSQNQSISEKSNVSQGSENTSQSLTNSSHPLTHHKSISQSFTLSDSQSFDSQNSTLSNKIETEIVTAQIHAENASLNSSKENSVSSTNFSTNGRNELKSVERKNFEVIETRNNKAEIIEINSKMGDNIETLPNKTENIEILPNNLTGNTKTSVDKIDNFRTINNNRQNDTEIAKEIINSSRFDSMEIADEVLKGVEGSLHSKSDQILPTSEPNLIKKDQEIASVILNQHSRISNKIPSETLNEDLRNSGKAFKEMPQPSGSKISEGSTTKNFSNTIDSNSEEIDQKIAAEILKDSNSEDKVTVGEILIASCPSKKASDLNKKASDLNKEASDLNKKDSALNKKASDLSKENSDLSKEALRNVTRKDSVVDMKEAVDRVVKIFESHMNRKIKLKELKEKFTNVRDK